MIVYILIEFKQNDFNCLLTSSAIKIDSERELHRNFSRKEILIQIKKKTETKIK